MTTQPSPGRLLRWGTFRLFLSPTSSADRRAPSISPRSFPGGANDERLRSEHQGREAAETHDRTTSRVVAARRRGRHHAQLNHQRPNAPPWGRPFRRSFAELVAVIGRRIGKGEAQMGAHLLEPRRVRHPAGPYGWTDLRAVTDGHLERIGRDAALVYLFLCTVGDRQGISFWSHSKMSRILGLSIEVIETALERIAAAELVAVKDRVVQVLPIPGWAGAMSTTSASREDRGRPARRNQPGRGSMPAHPPPEPQVPEDEIHAYQSEARAQMARFLGSHEPSPAALRALAYSLALKARKGEIGQPVNPCSSQSRSRKEAIGIGVADNDPDQLPIRPR